MKLIYIDIDTLRPDHLGCYGYHRNTSPYMDELAKDSIVFNSCFVPDAPCLPSRAALHHGRFGIHNGAVCHGGTYADPYPEGPSRNFQNTPPYLKYTQVLKNAGYYNCMVSSFAGRHNSWWYYAGFHEIFDIGKGGGENQDEVIGEALEKIERHKDKENFYLHFNIWDPHTSYTTPESYGFPFENEPPPAWMTQDIIDEHNNTFGFHCAANKLRFNNKFTFREPTEIKTMEDYKKHVDGYDTGIRYADEAVGAIIKKLKELGQYNDCGIIISSDHGENQGELNVYGDHQTADYITNRVPMIVKWPGITSGVNNAFHYQFDINATVLHLLGLTVPEKWDAVGFKEAFEQGKEDGRDYLVVSNAAWSNMRAVIWEDYILIKTYRDPIRDYPPIMLFNWKDDPHECNNLAESMPEKVNEGLAKLGEWIDEQLMKSDRKEDPFMKVIEEGGGFHTRGRIDGVIEYYEKRGDSHLVKRIKERYKKGTGYWKEDFPR
jgi:arylsulfatase A-like enzyme